MGFWQTARKTGSALTRIFAALSLFCCLDGAVHFCFCPRDPDGCGHDCHECAPESEDTCDHITIQMDAPLVTPSDVSVPPVAAPGQVPAEPSFARVTVKHMPPPAATGPPDDGGRRLTRAVRLHPRS